MSKTYLLFLSGYVGYYLFSSSFIKSTLDDYENQEVNILMNSPGGSTFDAMAISAILRNHGSVNVHMIGLCASAATIAAMGAKKITMDSGGLFLVHNCKVLVDAFEYMNAEKIDELIKNLEKLKEENNKIDIAVASMYASRCKKSQKELLDLMSKDCLLTAQEALEWGFVDEVTSLDEDKISDQVVSIVSSAAHLSDRSEKAPSGFMKIMEKMFKGKKSSNNTQDMKQYPNLSSLGFATDDLFSNGKEKQFDTAESVAKQVVEKISGLEAKISSLESQITSLSKQPADKPNAVVSSGAKSGEGAKSYADVYSEAKSMLDAIS